MGLRRSAGSSEELAISTTRPIRRWLPKGTRTRVPGSIVEAPIMGTPIMETPVVGPPTAGPTAGLLAAGALADGAPLAAALVGGAGYFGGR